ncbi:HK97 family phage prohead protease [Rhizobium ruizarguesonis]
MRPGAFQGTLADGKRKKLLFDHDDRQEMGSTDNGLEFAATAKGLAFRMALSDDRNGQMIYQAVMSNTRPCVSIGADLAESRVRWAGEIEYDFCARVDLQEISLVPEGAVESTYAMVVDLDEENPFLSLACREPSFAMDQAVANATARGQRVIDRLAKL